MESLSEKCSRRGENPFREETALFRLERRLVPCSVVGIGPSGMVEVLARFGVPGSKLCRCLIHPSRLLQSLPSGNANDPLEEEKILGEKK